MIKILNLGLVIHLKYLLFISFFLFFSPVLAETGEELYVAGDYSGALSIFEQELAQADGADQAQILNNIGTCYSALGELDTASEYFQKAVVADPEYWRGYINRGVVEERLGNADDAFASYGKVKSLNPAMYAEAQVKAGTLLAALGRNDEALSAYMHAESGATGNVKVDLYTGVGAIEFLSKNNAAAEEAFLKATEAGPDDAALAWTNLGVLRISQDRYDEAKTFFETAISHDPHGQSNAAEYLKKLGKIMGE